MSPNFSATLPTIEGWYDAQMEGQAEDRFEMVYFEPGCDHVVVNGEPAPLIQVARWGSRMPTFDEAFEDFKKD